MSELIVSVSGIRGTVGDSLTNEVAESFGRAFATMIGRGRTICIGRDTRGSGPVIAAALTKGLTTCGVSVVDLGVVSTPGVALMITRLVAAGGAVVTASHNPIEYNGIKFMTPEGLGLPAARAAELKRLWEAGEFAAAETPGTVTTNDETNALHIDAVCEIVDVDAIAARKFKVVLDSINGAGCRPGRMLLKRLGCELIHVNGDPTGIFAHMPEPREENLTSLCEAVR